MPGIASLPLRTQAENVQEAGRGPDTYLVHMGPKELASMEHLANQKQMSLTVNPKTGLYEVGILQSMLPALVGAAAMYFTGGAAAPWVGALAGAGTGALLNKDNRLMGALTGGLGGFAGSSLAGSLGAGAAAAEGAAATTPELAAVGANSVAPAVGAATGALGPTSVAEATQALAPGLLEGASQVGVAGGTLAGAPAVPGFTAGYGGASDIAYGDFAPLPETGFGEKVSNWWDKQSTMGKLGIGAAGLGALSGSGSNGLKEPEKQGGNYQDYEFHPAVYGPDGRVKEQASYIKTKTRAYAGGGIAGLSQGRMVKGPGDGLSDSIPANIDGEQEAALADGEFVIPADVVSALGAGSTDAGARRLYKMLDQVRIAAHGRRGQVDKIPKAALAV